MDTRTSTNESDEEGEDQASDEETDNGTQHTPFFSLDARSSVDVQASGVSDSDTLTIAPSLKKDYSDKSGVVWQEVSDGQGGSYFWNRSTNETTWDRPKAESLSNPPLYDESHRQEPHVAPVPQDNYQGMIPEEQSSGKARRMRQRDLERSLESGNLSALTAGETEVLYQPDVSDWNPHQNGAQMPKKEVMTVNFTINYHESYFFAGFLSRLQVLIASVEYDPATGESQTVYKPSKVQKRKHQINSLAYAAADRELELMEKRGASNKTKFQTQAKYGW